MTTPAHPPAGYDQVLARLTAEVRAAQTRALRVVSTGMVQLYWTIGNTILERQAEEGWGTKVVDRLSDDLRKQFPDLKGLGRANIHSMRRFAAAWTWDEVVQQPVGQLPWGHIIELLTRTDDPRLRSWYAAQAVEHSWTRAVLHHHLSTGLHDRLGAAPTNFNQHLEPHEASRAAQAIKDPYVFDFLALGERATERDLEQALMDRLTETLMELGRGFTFVGRQLRFDVDGQDYFPDLVFFHTDQLRYVVVELKIDRFKPDYAGQLGFYVALVDDTLRNPDLHALTIGLLLCATRSDAVVRYALAGNTILERQAEEGWGTKVVDRLSDDLRKQLPDLKGLGRANIHSMRRFAAAWTWDEVVQQPVGQLPWGTSSSSWPAPTTRARRDRAAASRRLGQRPIHRFCDSVTVTSDHGAGCGVCGARGGPR